jgi:hypothetical protein
MVDINQFTLKPIISSVFTPVKSGYWTDLKSANGKPDGLVQSSEIIQDRNDVPGVDDNDVYGFLAQNFDNISDKKIEQLFNAAISSIKANPLGAPYLDYDSSGYTQDILALIVTQKPERYTDLTKLLKNNNFLVRWCGVSVLSMIQNKKLKGLIREDLQALCEKERKNSLTGQDLTLRGTYYTVNELYSVYLDYLKELCGYPPSQLQQIR